jgi:transcriptional regulator GlxA family with amidase domain
MRMAFIIFDNMTMLDLVGFHNTVTWLKKRNYMDDLTWHFCSNKGEVIDDRGMIIKADYILHDLSTFDAIFIPGGMATRQLIHDDAFMDWVQTAHSVKYKISVCTGALILGAAGFLKDKKVTTNPLEYDLLEPYCKEVLHSRVVKDGDLYTGGGITASIDLGLFFIESITCKEVTRDIQKYLDYPFYNQKV